MANGQVTTGFSMPYIAKYSATGGSVTYTDGVDLARGVDVEIAAESSDENNFYTNNVLAESAGARFTSGTLSLTIDGLLENARKLAFGLPEPSTVQANGKSVKVYDYDDQQEVPYLGFACVMRTMEDGVTYYTPVVLTKIQFTAETMAAATQEEEIEWQTTPLEANILRDDSATHKWKRIGERQTSEADAVAVYKAILDAE